MDERNSKFRDHEAMLILGIPDTVVRELVDAHVEATSGAHSDVRDVELAVDLKREECPVNALAQSVFVLHAEFDNLMLRKARPGLGITDAAKNLRKFAVTYVLIDSHRYLASRLSRDIETQVRKVRVDATSENIFRLSNRPRTIRRANDDFFSDIELSEIDRFRQFERIEAERFAEFIARRRNSSRNSCLRDIREDGSPQEIVLQQLCGDTLFNECVKNFAHLRKRRIRGAHVQSPDYASPCG